MSCDHNRAKFFEIMSASGVVDVVQLERVFQQNRRLPASDGERLSAEAKTRKLFAAISAQGLKPPTHSADGLPRTDARPGYAAVYDLLRQHGLLDVTLQQITSSPENFGLDGRDPQGFDRWGYDKDGFDQYGMDRQGFYRTGWDKNLFNRHGFGLGGYGRDGFNLAGYDAQQRGRDGLTHDGYDPNTGLDPDGYDRDGFDQDGFDRSGYNRAGLDRTGQPDPAFAPNADGIYPDGCDSHGFGRDGYALDGYDRYGFGRDGYNRAGVDRNGYNRQGRPRRLDLDGYDQQGYKLGEKAYRRFDRAGYDENGFDANFRSASGYDSSGLDSQGNPRLAHNARGKLVPVKYKKDGFDENGFDRWGFHRDTGLTAPDANGRRINSYGWVYDEKTRESYDPADPTRRARHRIFTKPVFIQGRRSAVTRVCAEPYFPPAPAPPIIPFAPMSEREYSNSTMMTDLPREQWSSYKRYDQMQNRTPNLNERRPGLHPKTSKNGIRLRCPHCGQFTGGTAHNCPNFGGQTVLVYHSGLVQERGKDGKIWASPLNPDFDPRFDNDGGYDEQGRDRNGFDRYGYNERGFDHEGYSRDGHDIFGYDRDGFDRHGYNNAGRNRRGERREGSLAGVASLIEEDQDLLANQDLARLYSQIATGLLGKPRRVVLQEGEGFATDMKGTIYADPYPLGRHADPRHNLVVTRAGIYHELGHEQFTPTAIWEQVLAVHQGQRPEAGLGEAGCAMLPRFYNIVEDGRMERQVAASYAGAAEILAASCHLEPRWSENVSASVADDQQVFWALLYTGLPYFRVRAEVREAMSPRARALFDELEPLVSRAVRGTPEDAYRAAVHLARRFEEEGLLQLPPKEQDYSKQLPKPAAGNGEPGAGKWVPGQPEDHEDGQGAGRTPQDEPGPGRHSAVGEIDPENGSGTRDEHTPEAPRADRSIGDPRAASTLDDDPSPDFLTAALSAVERDAASAIETGVRGRSRAETIGKPLHHPLPDQGSMSQRYRSTDGLPTSANVSLPVDDLPHPELDARRERHRQVASLMAKPLRAIREQTEQRLRRLPEGRLDRRQLVNAVKGLDDVHTAIKEQPQTSFAASIAVDMSGSMGEHIRNRELFDAVMVLGDTFGMLDVSHEVRAFGSSSAQVKSMDEPFAARRAAWLASGDLGGTRLNETAGLAHSSLLARGEKNRLMVCLSDGDLSDHAESVRSLRQARTNGILTFGIFLGAVQQPGKLDELYGKGNWTSIQSLSDMPKAVAQRLSTIFKSMR